jgi:hypothetical protein
MGVEVRVRLSSGGSLKRRCGGRGRCVVERVGGRLLSEKMRTSRGWEGVGCLGVGIRSGLLSNQRLARWLWKRARVLRDLSRLP